jgi:hypothetical protein
MDKDGLLREVDTLRQAFLSSNGDETARKKSRALASRVIAKLKMYRREQHIQRSTALWALTVSYSRYCRCSVCTVVHCCVRLF